VPEAVQKRSEFRFPGESDEYRRARDELLQAEIELRRQTERVAAQRRELPLGGAVPTDYVFDEWDEDAGAVRQVRLSELFGDKDTLFLYSFMIVPPEQGLPFVGPCPSCTSIIDGIDGALPHITQRMAFAVAAKPPIEEFRRYAEHRGWRHVTTEPRTPTNSNGRWRPCSPGETAASTTFGRASSGPCPTRGRARATSTSCGRSGLSSTARPRAATTGARRSSTARSGRSRQADTLRSLEYCQSALSSVRRLTPARSASARHASK